MEKQQTAVEWLETQFQKDNLSKEILNVFKRSFEQAKAMEKEQIKDAWFDGVTNWDSEKEVEDYINETFKSE